MNLRNAQAAACVAGCVAGAWWAGVATAHDYWLEPAATPAAKGEDLVLHLLMGERLQTEEEQPLNKERISRFDLYGDRSARRDLLAVGQENQLPVAKTHLDGGSALVVMDRKPRPLTLEPEKFNQYLAAEGFDAIIAQRARLGQAETSGRESYTRYLKCLIQEASPAAATANTLYKRRVGQRLELLLENDPGRLEAGGKLTVKVLFEGNPLVGAKVFACHRAADDKPPYFVAAVTSAQGLADFKLDQPGLWLVRTVHMRAATGALKAEAQWESFWAAYSFAAKLANAPTILSATPPPSPPR